jgi:hypothetical protein
VAKTSGGAGLGCVEGVEVGLYMGGPWLQNPPPPNRARFYHYSTTFKGAAALGPLVVSANFAHLRVWEVG